MRAPFAIWPTRRFRRRAARSACAPQPTKPPPDPLKPLPVPSKTPTLSLPIPGASSHGDLPPSPLPPTPRDGCNEREVKRALARVDGRPHRVRALIAALVSAGPAVSAPLAERVSKTIAADPALRLALIDLIATADRPPPRAPIAVAGPPRERLRLAWAAAALAVAGPPPLRAAVASDNACARALASVFTAHNFDAARAALAADVLRASIADCPRVAAAALATPAPILNALVAHVDSNPSADLLARLVATRVFGANDAGAVVPANKRALAALTRHRVLHLLADKFVACARKDARACAPVAAAMAEMSARAAALPRMFEDPDERGDGYSFGVAHLSIVSAHVYNDALDYLVLPVSPDPLLAVLDAGIEHADDANVVVPAIELLARALRSLLAVRASALPLVRTAAREKRTTRLEDAVLERMPRLLPLLAAPPDKKRVGRARLALVDALTALLAAASASGACALLEKHALLDALLSLLDAYPCASVLHTRIGSALTALLGDRERCASALQHSSALSFFANRANDKRLLAQHSSGALAALLAVPDGVGVPESRRESLHALRERFAPTVAASAAADRHGLRKAALGDRRAKPHAERLAARGARALEPSEDRGQLLYVRSGMQGSKGDASPAHLLVEAAHAAFGALRT